MDHHEIQMVERYAYGTAFWSIKAQIGTRRQIQADQVPIWAFIDQKAVPYAFWKIFIISTWSCGLRQWDTTSFEWKIQFNNFSGKITDKKLKHFSHA